MRDEANPHSGYTTLSCGIPRTSLGNLLSCRKDGRTSCCWFKLNMACPSMDITRSRTHGRIQHYFHPGFSDILIHHFIISILTTVSRYFNRCILLDNRCLTLIPSHHTHGSLTRAPYVNSSLFSLAGWTDPIQAAQYCPAAILVTSSWHIHISISRWSPSPRNPSFPSWHHRWYHLAI